MSARGLRQRLRNYRSRAWLAVLYATVQIVTPAGAQHHHPPQHAALHDEFYSTWFRPDDRRFSCCNKKDCEPVEARVISGQWHVLRPADGKWLPVERTQLETERDSPDGRNHACFQPPESGDRVHCFLPAGGT